MTQQPFTPEQRAEIEQMIHDAIVPVARQLTTWVQRERARLTDPRRSWTGRPVGATPPTRTNPTGHEQTPPPEPDVHVFRDPPGVF